MNSALQSGNRALREGQYAAAVPLYLQALEEAPALARFVGFNIAMARRGWRAGRDERDERKALAVAVCGGDLARCAARMTALAGAHAEGAQLALVGWLPGGETTFPESLRRSAWPPHALSGNAERFVVRALAFVAAHPADVVQLAGAGAPEVIVALLYKLLWDSRLLVDLEQLQAPAPAPRAVPALAVLTGAEWAALAATQALRFDVKTVATKAAHDRYPKAVLAEPKTLRTVRRGASAPLAPDALQLLAGLPLPPSLKELLPQIAAASGGALPVVAPNAPPPLTAATEVPPAPVAHPALPSALPAPAPADPRFARAYRPAAPQAWVAPPEVPWVRAAELGTHANDRRVDVLGTAIALAEQDAPTPGRAAVDALLALHGHGCFDGSTQTATRWALGGAQASLVDLWFTRDDILRLRLERADDAESGNAFVVRALQVLSGGAAAQVVAERVLAGPGPHFVDVELPQPWFPMALVLTTPDGHWLDATLLPFPSLARGGAHHGEVAASGPLGEAMSNLAVLSNGLLAELLGWEGAPPLAVGAVEVDLAGASGGERLLAPPLRQWLGHVMRLSRMRAQPGTANADMASLAEECCRIDAPAADRDGAPLVLTLPADALPTLATLVSRRLALPPGAEAMSGPWIVSDGSTGRARALVTLPPLEPALLALQPADQALPMPLLRGAGTAGAISAAAPLPLAVRFADPAPADAAVLLQPTALDAARPLLRTELPESTRRNAHITLLLPWQPGDGVPQALLESIARQTVAASVDALVMAEGDPAAVLPLLERSLPGQHALHAATGSFSARLNAAAARARGQYLLIARPDTRLHDPRTLETLLVLAGTAGVASASCTLLREVSTKKGSEVRLYSGGLFPRQLSFNARPTLVIDEPVTSTAFPRATYPVLANGLRLVLVSTQAWGELGGLDVGRFPGQAAALDFALRAARAGWRHLCTGAVTASTGGAASAEEYVDTHAPGFMPLERWHDVLAAASVIRDFEV